MKSCFKIKQFNLAHGLFILMFIIYLFFANTIFLDIIHAKGEQALEETTLPQVQGQVDYWVQDVQFRKTSWKDMIYIGGGIIKGDMQQKVNLPIDIILKNITKADEIYKVTTEPLTVEELRDSVVNDQNFQTLFSIHGLKKSGVYRIGIQVEKSSGQAFIWTNNYLEKNGDEIIVKSLDSFISSQTKLDFNNLGSVKAQGGIDNIEMSTAKETDVLKIYGWAVVPDKKSEQQKGYVVLKDAKGNRIIYDTFAYTSPMVAEIFKSGLYGESGIYAAIPASDVADGEYEVCIYTENDGLYEMEVKKAIVITDGGKKVNTRDINTFISSQTKLDFNTVKPGKVQGGIDKIESSTAKETSVLKIYGWAVVPDKKSEQQKGYVVLKDAKGNRTIYDTFAYTSPMVAELFKSDLYNESGIYAAIPVSNLIDDEYEVYIYTENDGLYEMEVNKLVEIDSGEEKLIIKDK